MMTRVMPLVLLFASTSLLAVGKQEVRSIIENAYPGARVTEIERETYHGQQIYEVDFKYEGENLEAIISLDGEIITVHVDD